MQPTPGRHHRVPELAGEVVGIAVGVIEVPHEGPESQLGKQQMHNSSRMVESEGHCREQSLLPCFSCGLPGQSDLCASNAACMRLSCAPCHAALCMAAVWEGCWRLFKCHGICCSLRKSAAAQ
jgi:hypothetical protein